MDHEFNLRLEFQKQFYKKLQDCEHQVIADRKNGIIVQTASEVGNEEEEQDDEISKQKFIMRLSECKRLCIEYIATFEDKNLWIDLMKKSKISDIDNSTSQRNTLKIPQNPDSRKQSIKDLNSLEKTDFTAKILDNIAKLPK